MGTNIPVAVILGPKPGPTLALVAGAHGTEYASIIALEKLIRGSASFFAILSATSKRCGICTDDATEANDLEEVLLTHNKEAHSWRSATIGSTSVARRAGM